MAARRLLVQKLLALATREIKLLARALSCTHEQHGNDLTSTVGGFHVASLIYNLSHTLMIVRMASSCARRDCQSGNIQQRAELTARMDRALRGDAFSLFDGREAPSSSEVRTLVVATRACIECHARRVA